MMHSDDSRLNIIWTLLVEQVFGECGLKILEMRGGINCLYQFLLFTDMFVSQLVVSRNLSRQLLYAFIFAILAVWKAKLGYIIWACFAREVNSKYTSWCKMCSKGLFDRHTQTPSELWLSCHIPLCRIFFSWLHYLFLKSLIITKSDRIGILKAKVTCTLVA